jgi:hypothetical protein
MKNTIRLLVIAALLVLAITLVACGSTATQAPCPTAVACKTCPTCPELPTPVVPPTPVPNAPAAFNVFSPGGTNVPPGVPVYLRAGVGEVAEGAAEGTLPDSAVKVVAMYPAMGPIGSNGRPTGIKSPRADDTPPTADGVGDAPFAWTLVSAPEGSAAVLYKEVAEVPGLGLDVASFIPDVEGEYVISVAVTDETGAALAPAEVKIVVTKYAGNESCKGCHSEQYDGWATTLHGTAFTRWVNENAEAEYFTAGYGCARCHTVGYYPVAQSTGGWWELLGSPDNWPKETIALNAFNGEAGMDTFTTAFSPEVQAVSNIGCESCHGPAAAHVAAPSPDTAPKTNAASETCNQCHNASGHHTRGGAVANSAHGIGAAAFEGANPSCARCHSSAGFIATVKGESDLTEFAVADTIGCAACHDPHAEGNAFQLRLVGTVTVVEEPASASFTVTDAGLSAVCYYCHSARRAAAILDDPAATRYTPHRSVAAENLSGVGGYTWGATLENSFHVNIGKGVIGDEKSNQPGFAFNWVNGGEAPGSCVLCHMYITPGGVWDTADSMAVPGHQKIGGHAFGMITELEDGTVVEHTAPCQQCHPGMTDFNLTADADYDGDGTVEGVADEILGLKDLVKAAIATQKDTDGVLIAFNESGSSITTPVAKLPLNVKAAWYNYSFVNATSFVHNFKYSVGLLQVTVKELTGKDVKGAVLLYTK